MERLSFLYLENMTRMRTVTCVYVRVFTYLFDCVVYVCGCVRFSIDRERERERKKTGK